MAAHSQWNLKYLVDQVRAVCEITPDGCWLWRYGTWAEHKYVDEDRYPKIMIKGVRQKVAYWILEATGRPRLSPEMCACHSCDRPPCVSPAHLRWGTVSDNVQDCADRGRHPSQNGKAGFKPGAQNVLAMHPELRRVPTVQPRMRGDQHWTRLRPDLITWQGTNHYRARLDPDKVREIRARWAAGQTLTQIRTYFGVGETTVWAVIEGRTWKHVK